MTSRPATPFFQTLAAVLTLILVGGCSLGPAKLPATRMDYNLAVQRSSNEEMLMNLVRMKYFEQPLFLQVGSIASSFNYNVTGTAGATIPDQRDFARGIFSNYSPSISATYSDSPTVTYTPFQGQTYAQQFLAELDFERFVVLYRAGWDIEYLFRVLVNHMGDQDFYFDNRTGYFEQETRDKIVELAHIIGRMDDRGQLDIVTASPGKDQPNITIMTMRFKSPEQLRKIESILGIKLNVTTTQKGNLIARLHLVHIKELELGIDTKCVNCDYTPVAFSLRNCLRAMDTISQGVEVPKELAQRKAAFDLRDQFPNMMDVHAARTRPTDAYVTVNHGGWWYFIRDEDTRSKELFQLMLNIFALQSADPPKTTPVLTLPVGGN